MDYARIYEYRFRDSDPAARAAVWVEIAADIVRRTDNPARVLDVAAGGGEFIGAVVAPERWAVDMVDRGLSSLDGVKVVIAEESVADLPEGHFDLIFLSNLLEHLPTQLEVAALLGRCAARLAPGGRLAVLGPNFRYVAKEYFDFADHVLALTHNAVAEHLYGVGLSPDTVIPRYLPYSFKSRLPASPALVRRYLQTPLAWKLLGKQFLVIGTKPG